MQGNSRSQTHPAAGNDTKNGGIMHREVYRKIWLLCSYHTCGSAAKCLVVSPAAWMNGRVSRLEAELDRELSADESEPTYHLSFHVLPWSPSDISGRCFTSALSNLEQEPLWRTLTWNLTRILRNRVPRLTKITESSATAFLWSPSEQCY